MSTLRICFVGLKCYDLLAGAHAPRFIGGVETQLTLLAQGLSDRGHAVPFVTYDHGQPDAVKHGGITVYKAYAPDAGVRGLRFLHPRWTGIAAALKRADADVYYQMGAGCETGQTALWCRTHRRPFVFATASDADCVPELPLLRVWREKFLYRWGLRHADAVLSQTATQERLLQENFGLSSKVAPACCRTPQNGVPPGPASSDKPPHVLWIGRISQEKRPDRLLEVARLVPTCVFDVFGDANADTAYARRFREEALAMPSIRLHGKVPGDEISRALASAVLLVNTSDTEGFPSTFIEAWSHGVPVISMVDPDGMIRKYGLGWTADSVEGLAAHLKSSVTSPQAWLSASAAARHYYLDNHTLDACMAKFEQVFQEVLGQ